MSENFLLPCKRTITMILSTLLLTGIWSCSMPNPFPKNTYLPLAYFSLLESAPATTLEKEHKRLARAGSDDASLITTVQLAMLLSVPPDSTSADKEQAILLLERQTETARVNTSGLQKLYHAFASLWLKQLQLNMQLQTAIAKEADQQQEIRQLHEEISELKATIAAFTSIEQELIQREIQQGQP